ncbi:uncharacterized protein FIBRA_08543 [Fibroporia radiculosa]|uniref:Uncharacterized protein n=1 Tax=Fibroporia radiculosa TaxID=599839 RepID=J4I2X5_9APHY|nr:uncharacterized protein FIBRA_08543 [Fibroporia radiculosa]CCM06292.1 predicted protein [Fibroporia radiculosa]
MRREERLRCVIDAPPASLSSSSSSSSSSLSSLPSMSTPRQSYDTTDDALRPGQSRLPQSRSPPPPDPSPADSVLSDDSRRDSPEPPSSSHLSPPRSLPSRSPSSPLNPNASVRRPRKTSSPHIQLVASDESHAFASQTPTSDSPARRGSMILYKFAPDDTADSPEPPALDTLPHTPTLPPADSLFTLSYDSKYPSGSSVSGTRRFIPYAFDPGDASKQEAEDDDYLYQPEYGDHPGGCMSLSWRGMFNLGALLLLIGALLALFVCYPVISFVRGYGLGYAAVNNANVNSTGQAVARAADIAFHHARAAFDAPLGTG